MFPENDVYVVSKLTADPSLDVNQGIRRIILDETFHESAETIEPEELRNSLVVFDDVDTINDKEVLKKIIALRNDFLKLEESLISTWR